MLEAIWYHLYNLKHTKNMENTHGRVLLLVKLQVFSLNCTTDTKSCKVSYIINQYLNWNSSDKKICRNGNHSNAVSAIYRTLRFLFSPIKLLNYYDVTKTNSKAIFLTSVFKFWLAWRLEEKHMLALYKI